MKIGWSLAAATGTAALFLLAGTARSQEEGGLEDEFALLQEEQKVYTAARHEQDIAESPSAITVITREQIENTFCTSVACLLRFVPEVDVRQVKPAYSSVGARALTGEAGYTVLALVDGREVNFEAFGPPFWEALPVHLEDIERIEVIRGPGSALYGANAHSIVVSIITRKITTSGAEVFLGAGEDGNTDLHLRLNQVFGDWRLQLSGSRETSGSFDQPGIQERELNRIRLHLAREAGGQDSNLDLGLVTPDGLMHLGLSPGTMNNCFLAHAVASHQVDFLLGRVSFNYFRGDILPDLPLFLGNLKLGELETFNFINTSLDAEVQTTWKPWTGNLLIAGANYRWITFLSKDNEPQDTNQHRAGVYFHDEQRLLDQLLLTGGLRFDYNNISPPTFSPRLAGVWRFTPNHQARLAWGMAFHKPAFIQTSFHDTSVIENIPGIKDFITQSAGNPDLANESIMAFEAGYLGRFLDGRLSLEADVFYNRYRDTINFFIDMKTISGGLPDLAHSTMEYRNTGRDIDSIGGSVSLTFYIKESLHLNANYTYRFSFYVSDPPGGVPEVGEGKRGERVPWEPAHLFNLSGYYLMDNGLRFGLGIHATSSSATAFPEDGGLFGTPVLAESPAHWFASAFIAYRILLNEHLAEIGIRAANVFDQGYRDTPSLIRTDGKETGGEQVGRIVMLFLRAAI